MKPKLTLVVGGATGRDVHDVLKAIAERLGSLEAVNSYLYDVGQRRLCLHDVATGRRARRPALGGSLPMSVVTRSE